MLILTAVLIYYSLLYFSLEFELYKYYNYVT